MFEILIRYNLVSPRKLQKFTQNMRLRILCTILVNEYHNTLCGLMLRVLKGQTRGFN